jgi:hypothetical protein
MIIIDLYLEDPKTRCFEKGESITINDDVDYGYLLNLDNARMYVIKYLKSNLFDDLEYKISVSSGDDLTINVYIKHNVAINREVKIKKILDD